MPVNDYYIIHFEKEWEREMTKRDYDKQNGNHILEITKWKSHNGNHKMEITKWKS